MSEFILFFLISLAAFFIGQFDQREYTQSKCVAKYSEMPHNKVEAFCKELLLFKNETK